VDIRGWVLLVCVLIAGCGGGEAPKPEPVSGPAKQVASVIQRLQKATAAHDFATICDDLLSAATRSRAGGRDCASVLGERAGDIRRPRIRIRAIDVQDRRAAVRVQTTAVGQAPATDVIRLVREDGGFRISSLGR
jgi:hypothetical protein